MFLVPACLLSALLGVAPGCAQDPAEEIALPLVSWQDLCDRPSRWLGKTVRFRIQFQGRVDTWNPYLTRFGTKRFAAIQAWSDEQFPWVRSEFEAPLARLFLRREGSCAWALEGAQTGSRFEVSAVVREVFLDVPWTEVLEVLPLPERIGEGTVIHAGKAVDLMEKRSWKLAQLEIDQAISDNLPAHARAELERLRADCRAAAAAEKHPKRSANEVRGSD